MLLFVHTLGVILKGTTRALCAVQFVGSWFVDAAHVGLKQADEPEKSKELRRMLSPFLRVQDSTGMVSIDL